MTGHAEQVAYLRTQCLPTIQREGWMVSGHNRTALDLGGNITYTAGLTEAGVPELAMAGLPHETAAVLLNRLARMHLAEELQPGRQVLLDGHPFLIVDAPGVIGPVARSLYGRHVRFRQVLWPDRDGRHPTDPVWRRATHPTQTIYDQPMPAHMRPTGDGLVGVLDEIEHRSTRPDEGAPS